MDQSDDDDSEVAPAGFLTWHGTVVRVDRGGGALIHARLWPVRDIASDWFVALPADGVESPWVDPDDARVVVRPVAGSRLVTMQRGDDYLCAERDTGMVVFNRRAVGEWERFLPVSAAQLARLRAVLSHGWSEAGGDAVWTPWLGAAMTLEIGPHSAGLMRDRPAFEGETIRLAQDGPLLVRGAALAAPADIDLARRPEALQAPVVAGEAAFRASPEGRLVLQGDAEYGFLPLALSRAHEDWMHRRWAQAGPRRLGRQHNACDIVREQNKYVLLERGHQGLVFDTHGASTDTAHLLGLNIERRGVLRREGGHIFADGQALEQAPYLAGPHVVFYTARLAGFYQWVIEALLPLHIMAPFLPAGTKLLLPGTLRQFASRPEDDAARHVDHLALLEAWGFGGFPAVEIDAPVCRVEEVYWLGRGFIEQVPAALVRRARADLLARLGPAGPKRAVYISRERTRRVANAAPVEAAARALGFAVHALEGMSPRAQMELFRDADFVVAAHGAALANLLCCAPGTRVLELSPDSEFRPIFAQLSDKLDLVHGVLPCAAARGDFSGDLRVDAEAFRMLVALLQARRAAA